MYLLDRLLSKDLNIRVRVYTRDFTADSLCSLYKQGIIVVPENLQRRFRWSDLKIALWGDSMVRGIAAAVPLIMVRYNGKFAVIDGKHRLVATCRVLEHPEHYRLRREEVVVANISANIVEIEEGDPSKAILELFMRVNTLAEKMSMYAVIWALRYVEPKPLRDLYFVVEELERYLPRREPEKAAAYIIGGFFLMSKGPKGFNPKAFTDALEIAKSNPHLMDLFKERWESWFKKHALDSIILSKAPLLFLFEIGKAMRLNSAEADFVAQLRKLQAIYVPRRREKSEKIEATLA